MIINKKSQRGFTLVELLVVIAIIGILATLLLLQLGVARQRARDAKRIADINQVRTAIELYYDDNGSYPVRSTFATLASDLAPKYLTLLPVDPLNTALYRYGYAFNPATTPIRYHLHAELEQWAQALNSDSDINSTGWTGETMIGANDLKATGCTPAGPNDCIYDTGQSQ
jgi:prepilin-type N-terminal cleavage/methylation domain-containing protein